MSTIIKRLKDKLGNFVLPITNTKAVYDDAGNRLDNTLNGLTEKTELFGKKLPNDTDFNSITESGHYSVYTNKNDPVNDGNNHTYSVIVISENDILSQMTTVSFGGDFENTTYTRTRKGGDIWSSWVRLATSNTISDAYDPSKTYSTGQYCIHSNTLWKSRVDNNIGNTPPNETYWTATSVGKNLITTNGEGKFGYLGADDSFIPFKNKGVLLNISPDIVQFDGAVYGENGRCNITGAFTYIRTQTSSSTSQEQTGFIRLGSFVDLTPYKKMKIKYVVSDCYYRGSKREKGQPTTSFYVMFALTTNKSQTNVTPSSYPCGDWLVNDDATLAGIEYEKEFDISSLEGMYYVISYIRNAHSVGGSQMPHLLYLYMESIELV